MQTDLLCPKIASLFKQNYNYCYQYYDTHIIYINVCFGHAKIFNQMYGAFSNIIIVKIK